jgi:hypothetical protein
MRVPIYKGLGNGTLAAILVAVTSLTLLPESIAKPLSCKSVYTSKYLNKPLHKAMATSGGRPPSSSFEMSCGWAFGYQTKQQAMKIALHDCRMADRNYRNRRDCKIVYAE